MTIVGHGDPFCTREHRDIDIEQRLGCTLETLAETKNDKTVWTTTTCVSPEMQKTILDQYQQWIDVDPERNATSSFPSRELPLTFKKAIQVLRHVLDTMYDISFQRHGNRKQFRGVPYYVMKLGQSKFFATTLLERKPMVETWLKAPRPDISDDKMLDIEHTHHIVKPGDAYLISRGQSRCATKASMQPLRPEDVLPPDEALAVTRSKFVMSKQGEDIPVETNRDLNDGKSKAKGAAAQDLFSNTPLQQTLMKHEEEKASGKRKARDDMAAQKRQKTIAQAHQSHRGL
jgi:hypothetical protein